MRDRINPKTSSPVYSVVIVPASHTQVPMDQRGVYRVAAKELNLTYCIGETILSMVYGCRSKPPPLDARLGWH